MDAATPETTPPEAVPFDWGRPLRVARRARRLGVSPWEALGWLDDVLADVEAHADAFGADAFDDVRGDGLPWPPDD